MIRVGIIGCGYWGPNLIRNFFELGNATVAACCDQAYDKLIKVKKRYPSVHCTTSVGDLLRDSSLDAIVVATPLSTHYPFAKEALAQGKHVLVEKPMAETGEQVLELMELATRSRRVLMVDHTFIYSGAVRKMKSVMESGELGTTMYFDSVRVNLGLIRQDTSVIWDLAAHDLSIMDFLLEEEPQAIAAVGVSLFSGSNKFVEMAYLTVTFSDNLLAHFHVNWLAPVKIRQMLIGGTQEMLVYNDLEPSEKVRLYDKGVTLSESNGDRSEILVSYRIGDVLIPKIDTTEPLRRVCEEFVSAIMEGRRPLTDGEAAYRVVRLLESAQTSLEDNGRPIELGGGLGPFAPASASVAHNTAKSL